MNSNFDDVGEFHEKFGLENVTNNEPGPRSTSDEVIEFRIKFMNEELREFIVGHSENNHEKMFDALLDLAYVVFGTAHLLGYPWQEGWDEVQRANITKERCLLDHKFVQRNGINQCMVCNQPREKHSLRGSKYDVIKPEGWEPPNLEAVLEDAGFKV